MADIKWIKLAVDMFDDEKILLIETLPESESILLVWIKLLCLAGKQNNSGVFKMANIPYTPKMFATIFRMKETTVELALNTFIQFEMLDQEDGVYIVRNWGKHQNLDSYEKKKANNREYMREYRRKQKLLASPEEVEPTSEETCKTHCKTNSKTHSGGHVDALDKEEEKKRKEEDIDKDFYSMSATERIHLAMKKMGYTESIG